MGGLELPVSSDSFSEGDAVPAGHGRSFVRYWVAGLALATVIVATVLLTALGGSIGPGPDVAVVGDSISMSHFSQTKSYKCNKQHAEELAQCEPASAQAKDADARRLAEEDGSSESDDESGDEAELSDVAGCKSRASDNYKTCCSAMDGGRCRYPCTRVCQQQYGTITKEYKQCCKRCPGGGCVDPWVMLKEVYELHGPWG